MLTIEYRSKPSALVYMASALLPKPRQLHAPKLLLRWRGVRAAPRDIEQACALAEAPRSERLPLLYFQIVAFRLQMAMLTHRAFPMPIWRMLQVRNRLVEHRPLGHASSVDIELRLAALRILEKGLEADLHMTASESSQLVWEGVSTFYSRGRFGPATAAAGEGIAAPQGPSLAQWTSPAGGALRFARLTGDYNPSHLVDRYARRLGFPRAFLHPQRVLGACLARLPLAAGTAPTLLEAWIKGPVPYGAKVRLSALEEDRGWRFALWTDIDARPAFVGRIR